MKLFHYLFSIILIARAASAQTVTETFGSGVNQFSIDFVTIGNSGNSADPNGLGSVSYVYNLGKFEVSRDVVLKASTGGGLGITLEDMTGNGGNRGAIPATGVSWLEAARFVNWLNTSKGSVAAYKFDASGNFQLWGTGDSGYQASNPFRNKFAIFWLPSTDEWWKGAYGSPSGNWYNYPTMSNVAPTATSGGTTSGTAVYNQGAPADVNNAGGLSWFGTMAQGGNAAEWMESALDGSNNTTSESRRIIGGAYSSFQASSMSSLAGSSGDLPTSESFNVGFRIAGVPEPSALSLLAFGLGGLAMVRRRRS